MDDPDVRGVAECLIKGVPTLLLSPRVWSGHRRLADPVSDGSRGGFTGMPFGGFN